MSFKEHIYQYFIKALSTVKAIDMLENLTRVSELKIVDLAYFIFLFIFIFHLFSYFRLSVRE